MREKRRNIIAQPPTARVAAGLRTWLPLICSDSILIRLSMIEPPAASVGPVRGGEIEDAVLDLLSRICAGSPPNARAMVFG